MPSLLEILGVLLEFIPQVFLLYLILILLEQSGLFALIARLLHCPVKDIVPVCLGFGCTTLAVCSARDNPTRHRLTYFLSFIPCTAQLPLLTFLLMTVLHCNFGAVLILYLICILLGIGVAMFVPVQKQQAMSVSAKLQWPNLWTCLLDTFKQTLLFAKKIFIAFCVSAFVIVILARFSFNFRYVDNPENSILFTVCGMLTPIFAPLGLGSPAVICALIFGIIAKEAAISVLLFFPDIVMNLPFATALSLVVFYLFYPKCISAQTAIANHCGRKQSMKLFIFNLLVAYLLAFVVYNLCEIII